MRKFYLENETGSRVNLNDPKGICMIEPTGLGAEAGDNFANLGWRFFTMTSERFIPQSTVDGTLVFNGVDSYAKYNNFVNWIFSASTLYFVYDPNGTEYYVRVRLNFLTKTEMNTRHYMMCPISLTVLTPWFKKQPFTLTIDAGTVEEPLRFPITYPYTFHRDTSGEVEATINGLGHVDAALVLNYTGAVSNPVVQLLNASGDVVQECSVSADASTSFVYSSLYNDSYILGDGVDLLPYTDISKDPYIRIPSDGASYEVHLLSDIALTGEAVVTIYYFYRSI